MNAPSRISRRTLTLGVVAAAATVLLAGAVYEVPRLFKRRARGHYADLVNRLDDPEQAAVVGRAIHPGAGELGDFASFDEMAASDLKKRLSKQPLAELMADDCADVGRMVEAEGWVIPLALAEICVLAAESI